VIPGASKSYLVVPCFNEASRLASSDYWIYLENHGFLLVFIDDGSTDKTVATIKGFGLQREEVLQLTSNQGKANALRLGIRHLLTTLTTNSTITMIDADGAFQKEEIVRITELAKEKFESGYQAVFSSRVKLAGRDIRRNPLRHMIGRLISALFALTGWRIPYDTQSGLKVFKPSADLANTLSEPFATRWFMEIELIVRMKERNRNFSIWEEPLMYWSETKGSKVLSVKSINIIFQVFGLIIRMRGIKTPRKL
jgi:glycosyltransferase involved in cell wall biosynthesis